MFLEDRGILDQDLEESIDERVETEIADAIDAARAVNEALDPADMFRYVYDEMPPALERQFEAFGGETDE